MIKKNFLNILFKILKIFKRIILIFFISILIILAGIKIYSLFIPDSEVTVLNDETRKELPGEFIRLSDGFTNYKIIGPSNGQTVIFIHGFFVPSYVWEQNIYSLTKAGFRVVTYDNFGRGYSDRPDITYNMALYTKQLLELIKQLELKTPVSLIGSSHGGAIIMSFAQKHPELVKKLILVNPAGLSRTNAEIQIGKIIWSVFSLAGVPKILNNTNFISSIFAKNQNSKNVDKEFINKLSTRLTDQIVYKGFRKALDSGFKNALRNIENVYKEIGRQNREILLIWGEKDKSMNISTAEKIISAIPNINYYYYPESGHIPHVSNPERFNEDVISFLQK